MYPKSLVEFANLKLHWFLSCYMCAQMVRETGRGMEGRDKNV